MDRPTSICELKLTYFSLHTDILLDVGNYATGHNHILDNIQ